MESRLAVLVSAIDRHPDWKSCKLTQRSYVDFSVQSFGSRLYTPITGDRPGTSSHAAAPHRRAPRSGTDATRSLDAVDDVPHFQQPRYQHMWSPGMQRSSNGSSQKWRRLPMLPLGTILQRLVLHVTGPILELDQVYMEFPGFVDDVFATVHILGRHREHNITTQQILRDLQLADDSTPTMTEHSGRANLAIGISVLDRFTIMYQHEARAQAAAAILNLGSYRYEVFHGYWATDDVAFFSLPSLWRHAGVIRLVVPSSDSSGTDDELLRVARAQPNTSDESNSE